MPFESLKFPWKTNCEVWEKASYLFLLSQVVLIRLIDFTHGKISSLFLSFCVPFSGDLTCALDASFYGTQLLDVTSGILVFHFFYCFVFFEAIKRRIGIIRIFMMAMLMIPLILLLVVDGAGIINLFHLRMVGNFLDDFSFWRILLWVVNAFILVVVLIKLVSKHGIRKLW